MSYEGKRFREIPEIEVSLWCGQQGCKKTRTAPIEAITSVIFSAEDVLVSATCDPRSDCPRTDCEAAPCQAIFTEPDDVAALKQAVPPDKVTALQLDLS